MFFGLPQRQHRKTIIEPTAEVLPERLLHVFKARIYGVETVFYLPYPEPRCLTGHVSDRHP
jgi:hypothetical protein